MPIRATYLRANHELPDNAAVAAAVFATQCAAVVLSVDKFSIERTVRAPFMCAPHLKADATR